MKNVTFKRVKHEVTVTVKNIVKVPCSLRLMDNIKQISHNMFTLNDFTMKVMNDCAALTINNF